MLILRKRKKEEEGKQGISARIWLWEIADMTQAGSGKRKSGGSLNCKAQVSATGIAHRSAGHWFLSISGHDDCLSCLPPSQLQVVARRFPTALGLYPYTLMLYYISLTPYECPHSHELITLAGGLQFTDEPDIRHELALEVGEKSLLHQAHGRKIKYLLCRPSISISKG